MFPRIKTLEELRAQVEHMPEMRFFVNELGYTIVCYMIGDSMTFFQENKHWARECRGITFDPQGNLVSRPFHKFFNIGESIETQPHQLDWPNLTCVMDKRDGSMVHPIRVNGKIILKTKKSFTSDVARFATQFANQPEQHGVLELCHECVSINATPIFEFTAPTNRIVLCYDEKELRLLHIRDNYTGRYYSRKEVNDIASLYGVKVVDEVDVTWDEVNKLLAEQKGIEGYVFQFADGTMVKAKTSWYHDLHHNVTFVTQRNVAEMVLNETVDDFKGFLSQTGAPLNEVEGIERKVKERLLEIEKEVEDELVNCKDMEKKEFAMKYKDTFPHFKFLSRRHSGGEVNYVEYYRTRFWKDEWPPVQLASIQLSVPDEDDE